jgi:hypothetical protein
LEDIARLDEAHQKKKKTAVPNTAQTSQPKNRFNNFEQRSYDYDQLEKMLLTTFSCNSRKISASRSTEISFPTVPFAIFSFWQNTQCSGHPEKNTAPDPASPEMQGSSQK